MTLLGVLTASTGRGLSGAIRAASVLLIAVLTAAAAQVSVQLPFTPVPFTLQPMVVLLGGAALGSRLGMASQAAYLLAGIAGLPVFAASSVLPQGPLRLLGPTGGYLMAYPIAAFLTCSLAERPAKSGKSAAKPYSARVFMLSPKAHQAPTIRLLRSSRSVSRQTPSRVRPMRSRRHTSRKPHARCKRMLATFSGNMLACRVQNPWRSDSSASSANRLFPIPCPRAAAAT